MEHYSALKGGELSNHKKTRRYLKYLQLLKKGDSLHRASSPYESNKTEEKQGEESEMKGFKG